VIATRTVEDYRAEARSFDAQAAVAESRGDDLYADRLRHRAVSARRAAEALAFRALRGDQ
jgi:hypothetical protein